jgi:hypothetical protein
LDAYKLLVGKRFLNGCFLAFLLSIGWQLQAQTSDSLSVITADAELPVVEVEKVHSAHRASLYSAVFPGLGQIYNKKYWKLPLVYGGIGGMSYAIWFNSKYYNIYRNSYRDFLIGDPGNTSYMDVIPPGLTLEDVQGEYAQWFEGALNNKKRFYKRYRDMSYIGMALVYVLNIVDASIDAHFYDFNVNEDLSLRIEPAYLQPNVETGGALGLQVRLHF